MRVGIEARISGSSLRMGDLLEQLRVATLVWVQSQGPVINGLFMTGRPQKHDRYTLFAVGFFEISLACIRRNLQQIVVFPE